MTHHTRWLASIYKWADAQSVGACAQPMPQWASPRPMECLDKSMMRSDHESSGHPDEHTHQSVVM